MAVLQRSESPSIVYWLDNVLYLNITNRCTNDCYFCLRRFRTGVAEFNLKLNHEPTTNEIIRELQNVLNLKPWKEVVFCGFGEPTMRLNVLLEVTGWISKNASKPTRVDTNGHAPILYPERNVVKELKEAGVSRLSVSLNAQDEATYHEVCKPKFDNAFKTILEFIAQARDADLTVEVTAVTIPEARLSEVEKIASDMGVKFRARPYHQGVW